MNSSDVRYSGYRYLISIVWYQYLGMERGIDTQNRYHDEVHRKVSIPELGIPVRYRKVSIPGRGIKIGYRQVLIPKFVFNA